MTPTQLLSAGLSVLATVVVALARALVFLYRELKKKDELILQLARNGISSSKFKMIWELLNDASSRNKGIRKVELDRMLDILAKEELEGEGN